MCPKINYAESYVVWISSLQESLSFLWAIPPQGQTSWFPQRCVTPVTRQSLFIVRTRTSKIKKSPLRRGVKSGDYKSVYCLQSSTFHMYITHKFNFFIKNQIVSVRQNCTCCRWRWPGDCFFRAVSHQLYGNANSHFYMRRVVVQYLVHNPEQFIQSNTEQSGQGYLQRMSCQWIWANVIIIQAVANCFNLSIHIAESNPTFSPINIVEPMNVIGGLNIYIGQSLIWNSLCLHSTK